MNGLVATLFPFALLVPAFAGTGTDTPRAGGTDTAGLSANAETKTPPAMTLDAAAGPVSRLPLTEVPLPNRQGQVRIEQRIILRITPRREASRQELLAQLPRGKSATKIEERKIGSCLPAENIAGVGTSSNNRLLLFMQDRRVISASLEKACNARDFYSGFYVEHSKDGKLCVKRDKIHSRAGVKCEIRQLAQLVAVKE